MADRTGRIEEPWPPAGWRSAQGKIAARFRERGEIRGSEGGNRSCGNPYRRRACTRELVARSREYRGRKGARAERSGQAAYPPTTWHTVTRLQSIKCVRLLWLMHYGAIKNGKYSAAGRVRTPGNRTTFHVGRVCTRCSMHCLRVQRS